MNFVVLNNHSIFSYGNLLDFDVDDLFFELGVLQSALPIKIIDERTSSLH
jgi:hypothetical protein